LQDCDNFFSFSE